MTTNISRWGYSYSQHDEQRMAPEEIKRSGVTDAQENFTDRRTVFARDRARVLHSAALRRLADKTQVVSPREGQTPRTRLTHSLEVGQISRAIAEQLGADGDLVELAGLAHDIGHPPYGHNGERALNELAGSCGGFEANAQNLRVLTRLEPKVYCDGHSAGLNLTRASLDACLKYPWTRSDLTGVFAENEAVPRKFGIYDEDASILTWIRSGVQAGRGKPLESQIMDWSDDIAYSVHDVEDGIISGRVDLHSLFSATDLQALAALGHQHYQSLSEGELIEAGERLTTLECVKQASLYDGSLDSAVMLKRFTSEMVGRFIGATISATQSVYGTEPLGRYVADLQIPALVAAEVMLLKTLALQFILSNTRHLQKQQLQRDRITSVVGLLVDNPELLSLNFQPDFDKSKSDSERLRIVIDYVSSLTESELENYAR